MHQERNEKKVWVAFQQGSTEALTAIYNSYIIDLYNYGARFTVDQDMLEDSIQDVFFKLWKQRTSLSEVSSIKFYLYKCLKTTVLDNLKKVKKNHSSDVHSSDFFFDFIPPADERIIEDEIEINKKKELQHIIQNHLTPRQKEALTLLFYDNLPYQKIAELLSLTPKSTYKLIYRALGVLRAHLENPVFTLTCCLSSWIV